MGWDLKVPKKVEKGRFKGPIPLSLLCMLKCFNFVKSKHQIIITLSSQNVIFMTYMYPFCLNNIDWYCKVGIHLGHIRLKKGGLKVAHKEFQPLENHIFELVSVSFATFTMVSSQFITLFRNHSLADFTFATVITVYLMRYHIFRAKCSWQFSNNFGAMGILPI